MIRLLFVGITLLTSILLITPPTKHQIDFRHSQINFDANERLISEHIFFDKWQPDVNIDPEIRVDSTNEANSINTKVVPSEKDYFRVEQYPTTTFTFTKLQ